MTDIRSHRHPAVRWARLATLAALALLASVSPALALALSITYVTTRGNDANDGLTPTTPCRTINAALIKAASPLEVRIAKGTYREAVNVSTTAVFEVILSGNWDTAFTTQSAKTATMLRPDTKQSGRVVVLNPGGSGAHLTATLTNLTVTGGNAKDADGSAPGGGVAVVAFSPAIATITLDRVTITGNRENVKFNNTFSGGGGLGVFTFGASTVDVTVRDSVFSRNMSGTTGGAIMLTETGGSHVTFTATRD